MSVIKVLLVGPYPPPFGGLAVQLCEWQRYLSKQPGYECQVLNIGESRDTTTDGCVPTFGYWDFIKKLYKYCSNRYLIHLLTNGHNPKSWVCACVCALVGLRNNRRTVLVFGSGNAPEYMKNASPFMRIVVRTSLRLGGYFICRNDEMRKALIEYGAASEKTAILPGFLGINNKSSQMDLPNEIQVFVNEHDPVLGATANVDPEYGIPLMLEAMEMLRPRYPRIGLLIIGPGEDSRVAFPPCKSPDSIYFTGPLLNSLVLSVMSRLTVFLRPTYFDGDSLSVREALGLGIPVVASDTGLRPRGVILFARGERDKLTERITHVVDHLEEVRSGIPLDRGSTTDIKLLGIYRQLNKPKNEHKCMTC
jgi:glycogen synthase